jgi:hypothetical protein
MFFINTAHVAILLRFTFCSFLLLSVWGQENHFSSNFILCSPNFMG